MHEDRSRVALQHVATNVLCRVFLVHAENEALSLLGDAAAALDLWLSRQTRHHLVGSEAAEVADEGHDDDFLEVRDVGDAHATLAQLAAGVTGYLHHHHLRITPPVITHLLVRIHGRRVEVAVLAVDVEVPSLLRLYPSPPLRAPTLLLLLVLSRLAPLDLALVLGQRQAQCLSFTPSRFAYDVLFLRAVVMEHAAVRVLLRLKSGRYWHLGEVGILHEGVARRIVHDEGEWQFDSLTQSAGDPSHATELVEVFAECLHALVHFRTGLLAIRLLLAELLADAAEHTLDSVQVSLLRLGRNVELHLRNADHAVVSLDHLAVQVLWFTLHDLHYDLVLHGELVANTTLLDGRSALDFV